MGFLPSRDPISICNRALGRIGQQKISGSLDDPQGFVMQQCAELYPAVIRTLLEQHHFGLATKRSSLISLTSDRGEWPYAYTPPQDMAFPVAITVFGSGSMTYYRELGALLGVLSGRPIFRLEGGVLYSAVADAELDYVSFDITEADFNQTFENLIIVFLASELAMPIVKDRDLQKDIYDEGMAKLNWAIAQSINLTRPTYGDRPTETELARGGGYGETLHKLGLPY